MKTKHRVIAGAVFAMLGLLAMADTLVGVSWSNFQEERWKTDEAAIKGELAKIGDSYVSADAGGSPDKQLADVDGLISKGAKVLIILAMDKDAIVPALAKAKAKGIPVVAYGGSRKCSPRHSRAGRSRSSARNTPTAGNPRSRRPTWTRS